MKNELLGLVALLLPFVALAAESADRSYLWKKIDKKDIPIEELAHAYFFHGDTVDDMLDERLSLIISQRGISQLRPALAEHAREMRDTAKIAVRARQICRDLANARSGAEFAAVMSRHDKAHQSEKQEASRSILARLDPDDRKALEDYLDTEFRRGFNRRDLDYQAMFAAAPFPSSETASITKRTCDGAAQAEARASS